MLLQALRLKSINKDRLEKKIILLLKPALAVAIA
jgi:hypothetical protein